MSERGSGEQEQQHHTPSAEAGSSLQEEEDALQEETQDHWVQGIFDMRNSDSQCNFSSTEIIVVQCTCNLQYFMSLISQCFICPMMM